MRAVTRMQGEPFRHQVGGEAIAKKHEAARYTAIYEIDSPDVLMSPEWRVQGEKGRWAKEVRPFTKRVCTRFGSFNMRENMVGTSWLCVTRYLSTSCRKRSGSNRSMITAVPPMRMQRLTAACGAA